MKTTITIVSLAAVITCLTLSAQETPRPQISAEQRFKQFDKNGDGKITREESGNARWFDTLDRNHDG
ncbi:MAG: EF-hand domain-containing protein, partial [Verrucomicrobia bacterium]|nr:EF-hand domain-containing protein [Verrucomicrobiota bacterium]